MINVGERLTQARRAKSGVAGAVVVLVEEFGVSEETATKLARKVLQSDRLLGDFCRLQFSYDKGDLTRTQVVELLTTAAAKNWNARQFAHELLLALMSRTEQPTKNPDDICPVCGQDWTKEGCDEYARCPGCGHDFDKICDAKFAEDSEQQLNKLKRTRPH